MPTNQPTYYVRFIVTKCSLSIVFSQNRITYNENCHGMENMKIYSCDITCSHAWPSALQAALALSYDIQWRRWICFLCWAGYYNYWFGNFVLFHASNFIASTTAYLKFFIFLLIKFDFHFIACNCPFNWFSFLFCLLFL